MGSARSIAFSRGLFGVHATKSTLIKARGNKQMGFIDASLKRL
jgi:hypothetical protein